MAAFAPVLVDVYESCLSSSPDELCDRLLDHMVDCDRCLDGCLDDQEQTCAVYHELQRQVKALGGAKKPLIIAI